MQLYFDTKNTIIKVKNSCFLIKNNSTQRIISPKRIESIGIISNVEINTSAIKLAAKNEIPIYFYDRFGKVEAELSNPNYLKHARLRYKQILFVNSNEGKNWAVKQIQLKTELQLQTIKRYKKETLLASVEKNELEKIIVEVDKLLLKVKNIDLEEKAFSNILMAYEGNIARYYFKAINYYLPKEFQFEKRTRKPAKDTFNAALNYMYGITYGHVTTAVKASGLDVYVGVLHSTPYKECMVFDCIEPVRPIIDRLLINLCREKTLNINHFVPKDTGYWIQKDGKKIILPEYANYLSTRIKISNRVLSIKNHIFWQCRDLKLLINNYDIPNNL